MEEVEFELDLEAFGPQDSQITLSKQEAELQEMHRLAEQKENLAKFKKLSTTRIEYVEHIHIDHCSFGMNR